ncbi:MAG: heme o synthase [Desulfurococcales archaeon]|nr:heme o synthase [Desulfurococcales archaeon]
MLNKIRSVILMMKPKQLVLLMITMYGSYFIAKGPLDPLRLTLLTLVGIGSAGGVTALNMYLEYDIDSVMKRTRNRPLPAKVLEPDEALTAITFLILIGVISGYLINKYVAFAALMGLYFDIIAYTELAKRRTEWALLFGSVAGSMPALGGWAAGRGSITLTGLLLSAIVYVWQPLHVAFIHYYYEDDYQRAGIPTIPTKLGYRAFAKLAMSSIVLSIIFIWIIILILGRGYVTGTLSTLLGIGALASVAKFLSSPSREAARKMIKFASPLVGIFFILLPIEIMLSNII